MISLVLRVLSRPFIVAIKNAHLNNKKNALAPYYIWFGDKMAKLQNHLYNRFIIKMDVQYKPIESDAALIKGIEYFYDIFFYYFAFGIPIMLILRRVEEQREEERKIKQNVMTADQTLVELQSKLEFLEKQIVQKGLDLKLE